MRVSICILLLLVSAMPAMAQQEKKDSLLKLLTTAKEDTSRARLLLKIADAYETNNQDSSIYYLEKSKQLSDRFQFKPGLYQYYSQSAIVSFTKGNYDLAMRQSNDALSTARELKDSNLIVNMLFNTGIVYQYLGQYDKQLEYSLMGLEVIERKNLTQKLSPAYHSISNSYYALGQYRKAIEYSLLSLKYHHQTNSNEYPNRVYASLGQAYSSIGNTDSALYYFNTAITSSVQLNDKFAEAAIYGFIADTYAARNEFKKMLTVSEKSLQLSRDLQSSQGVANSLYNIAYANYFNGNNALAYRYINEALDIAIKDSMQDVLKNIYIILSYITAKDNDFKTSLWAKRKSDSLQEAVLNKQVIKTTTELEKKYESEKKDKQIILQQSQLEKRKLLNYILISSAAALLILSLLGYRTYNQKKKLQQQRIAELETQQQLTATEAVLKGEEQERTRLAKDLHDGLGGMLSGIKYSFNTMKGNLIMTPENTQAFEHSMNMLDSSIKEMRRVAHNMMPEVLVKFGLNTALQEFCDDINQTGALQVNYQSIGMNEVVIEQITAITIYRVVQELINNTMKHASASSAIVQVSKTDNRIDITVEDNGKGFNAAILDEPKGIGWTNIRSRIGYLKGKFDVQSEPGKGTSVHIELNT